MDSFRLAPAGDGFDEFWSSFPRRQARIEAKRAGAKLKPTAEVQQLIQDALRCQVPTWTDLSYCPLPATYLRGERWTDEQLSPAEAKSADTRLPTWALAARKARLG